MLLTSLTLSNRGYVSEVQEKDAKICCPFTMLQKHNCDENRVCDLPPLQLTRFRWWNCPNCLHRKIDNHVSHKSNGAFMRNFQKGDEIKKSERSISFLKSEYTKKCLPSIQEPFLQRDPMGVKLGSLVSIYAEKENGSGFRKNTKEGTHNPSSTNAGSSLMGKICSTTGPIRMPDKTPMTLSQTTRIGTSIFDKHVNKFNASLTDDILQRTGHSFLNRSDETSHHKKAPKLRALSDIIDNDISMPNKFMEIKCSKSKKYEANNNGSRTMRAKGVVKNLHKQKHHLSMKKRLFFTMNEKEEEDGDDDNDEEEEVEVTLEEEGEASLMQWLRKLPDKNSSRHKRFSKMKSVVHVADSDVGEGEIHHRSEKHLLQIKSLKPNQILGAEKVPSKVGSERRPKLVGKVGEWANFEEKMKFSRGELEEDSDDFPMDIVELLARNRHKKRIKDSEVAASNLHNLSEAAEIMKKDSISDNFKAPHLKGDAAGKNLTQKNAKINQREGMRPIDTDHGKWKDLNFSCSSEHNPLNPKHLKMMYSSQSDARQVSGSDGHDKYLMLDIVEGKKLLTSQTDEVCTNLVQPGYTQGTFLKVSDGVSKRSVLGSNNEAFGFHSHTERELDSVIHKEVHNSSPSAFVQNGFVHETASPQNIYNIDAISSGCLPSPMDPIVTLSSEGFPPQIKLDMNQFNFEVYGYKQIDRRNCLQDEGTSNTSENGLRPFRPLPRLGVLSPLLPDELTSRSARWRTEFALNFPPGFSSKIIPSIRVDEEKCEAISYTDISNSRTLFYPESSRSILMDSSQQPLAEYPPLLTDTKKDDVGRAYDFSCPESCVVNKNPADFTMVSEDSEYMIVFDKLQTGYVPVIGILRFQVGHDCPRQQKKMRSSSCGPSSRGRGQTRK